MTLAFSTKINEKPTNFVTKIWACLYENTEEIPIEYFNEKVTDYINGAEFTKAKIKANSKKHTIRKDNKGRWKVDSNIHFVINNRTKKRFQFAPIHKVKSIQFFEIKYNLLRDKTIISVFVNDILQGEVILVNCKIKSSSYTVNQIALNDGFDSTNDFLEWFSEDFTGKIIHWTNLKY